MGADLDARVDRAVERLRARGFEFRPIEIAPWFSSVEEAYPKRLPVAIRSLYTRYAFPAIETDGMEWFSNLGDFSEGDMSSIHRRDLFLSPWLVAHGYFHFAWPGPGDPICADLSRGKNDPIIVRLDHEDILLQRKKVRVTDLAPSFSSLLENL